MANNLVQNTVILNELLTEIQALPNGASYNFQEKNVTSNDTYVPDAGYDGISKINVNVSTSVITKPKVIIANPYAASANSTSLQDSGISLTITEPGDYLFKWTALDVSIEDYATYTQLYKKVGEGDATAVGSKVMCNTTGHTLLQEGCLAGEKYILYVQGYRYLTSTYGGCGGLIAIKQD